MPSHIDRRKVLAEIDQRTWQLWMLSLLITGSLTFGFALFLFPSLQISISALRTHQTNLPQLVGGLLVLVLLGGIYIVLKQRELNALRNFVIASYITACEARDNYPRDSLTGVLDRSALPDLLKFENTRAERTHLPFSLVIFDIRNFTSLNEREGHMVGDLILKELALTLQKTVRQSDSVLRYEGDQFLCVLAGTPREGAGAFVRRVQTALERTSRLRTLTLDFGIASYREGMDVEALLAEAEGELTSKLAAGEPPSGSFAV